MPVMKTIFTFLLIGFAVSTASSQDLKSKDSLSTRVDRKFLGNGNKLLNANGSLPKHIVRTTPVHNNDLKIYSKPKEQLIVNRLLFTGKLTDHLSEPFLLTPELFKKTPDKY